MATPLGRRAQVLPVALLSVVLAGCSYIGGGDSPTTAGQPTPAPSATTSGTSTPNLSTSPEPTATPDFGARAQGQAHHVLEQWANFMADWPEDAIVFISGRTDGGGWRGAGADEAKSDFLSGMIEATTALATDAPPPGAVSWQDGTTQEVPLISAADALTGMIAEMRGDDSEPDCGHCLQVAGATLTTGTALTWRGEAEVPVWQFEFIGDGTPIAPISFVAVRDAIGPNDWDAWGRIAPQVGGAYGAPDGTELTVAFTGGACDTGHSIVAVESELAIVPIISTTAPRGVCIAVGVGYTLVLELESPLGNRALLDLENGWPAPVYAEVQANWPTPAP